MGSGRWRLEWVEEIDRPPPALWRPPPRRRQIPRGPGEMASLALVTAFGLLAKRGMGPTAWAASFRHDPIAFLLDASSNAIFLWAEGGLLYQNLAAERMGLRNGHPSQRRCCRFRCGGSDYLLEIIGQEAG